jgi:mono/diheme cytochrome c family protein
MRLVCFLIAVIASAPLLAWADTAPADYFEMKVRPLLAKNCFSCHTQSKMGGLSLTSREDLMKGGASGPAVKPGDAEGSLLYQAVKHTHARLKMPPSGKLSDEEAEILASWIKAGAVWPEHKAQPKQDGYRITPEQRAWWSFQPVKKPAAPAAKDRSWAQTDIDRFLLARMEAKGLKPAPAADRRTLIRRAYYDLTGLPPSNEEVNAFVKDRSLDAFAKVVDRLLASPRYGERWGRHWLDVARYADEMYSSTEDSPYPNAWRYRDWVVQAFNEDMPYDLLLKAQIAGDVIDSKNKEKLIGGLGFFSLSPEQQDDRVDAFSRGMLGITVACAQCHDHKFDPIPTKDYYSILGVFRNTRLDQYPLASAEVVAEHKRRRTELEAQDKRLKEFLDEQASRLGEILASRTVEFFEAARSGKHTDSLDVETIERLKAYLEAGDFEHPFLANWKDASFDTKAFQTKVLAVLDQKRAIDRENMIALGGKEDNRTVRVVEVKSLPRDEYMLWRDFFSPTKVRKADAGVFYYPATKIDRFLAPHWKQHADALRAELERRKKALPEMYPFLQVISDVKEPKNIRVEIRGNRENLGDEVPRHFLTILSEGEPKPFTKGSGRLELAEAVASPSNPLTSRVIANRVWLLHFGRALVATPSNFGQLGEKPTHPELLDYLAARMIEQGWSMKALHREIMLSSAYQLSSEQLEPNMTTDPDNTLVWRWSPRRLDVEPLRDTLLHLSGELDETRGGRPGKLTDVSFTRRTLYGSVSRRKLDGTLALFDFPNPVATSEQRIQTQTPLQQLFFLNSEFIQARAKALAARIAPLGDDDAARIRSAYRLLYQREAAAQEIKLGLEYLKSPGGTWPRYAQALLGSNELLFVN